MDPARATLTAVLWRRLDTPGHDACRLEPVDGGGWQLDGTAVFLHDGAPAQLHYRVACDPGWVSRRGRVSGWLGARSVDLDIARVVGGAWTLGGAAIPGLQECADLDLGFTPATNLLALQRLALADGDAADAPAAWLDVSAGTLRALAQRYTRRGEATYWYEAPSVSYAGLLEVTPTGFVRRYPGLWELEP